MPRLRDVLWGNRRSTKSGGSRPAGFDAPAQKRSDRYQLRPTRQAQPQLEWQWGQEENKLFQLANDVHRAAGDRAYSQRGPVASHPVTNTNPDIDRWRRPEATSFSNGSAASPPLVGEILPAGNGDETLAIPIEHHPRPAPQVYSTSSDNGNRPAPRVADNTLLKPFLGAEGVRRLLATRIALDEALDRWWTNGEHAPTALLRDGLLALEAGHDLDEAQRSFLLRTALRTGRGIVTALHYQLDTDRTAFLLKEALLDTKRPFDPNLINSLRHHDEQSEEWLDFLEHDLAYEATVASGKRSQLAARARQAIQAAATGVVAAPPPSQQPSRRGLARHSPPRPSVKAPTARLPGKMFQGWNDTNSQDIANVLPPLSHRWSLRWLFWATLMLFSLLRMGWPQLLTSAPMVEIPAGVYVISDPASSNPTAAARFRTVTLHAYAIDRHEVTNAAYRRCWEQDACPPPGSFDSSSRPGYFVNRSFSDFPVVNIDWTAANSYCAWIGKRLPTLEEWEVAASLAPSTGLRFSYPWGERFEMRVANSALSNLNDTQAVGTYHPAGSTSSGIMDMAGNVAEWTSMPAASMIDAAVVKGGSFQDQPEQLRNEALMELPRTTRAPWLGFRCAAEQ